MQGCRGRKKRLVAYLEATLSSRQARRLEMHLDTCQACQAARERLHRVSELLQCLRSPERSEEYWEQQLQRFSTRLQAGERRRPQSIQVWHRVFAWPVQTLTPAVSLLCLAMIEVTTLLGLEGQTTDLLIWWLLELFGT